MRKIVNKTLVLAVAGFMAVFSLPLLVSAQTTTTPNNNGTSSTSTTDNGTSNSTTTNPNDSSGTTDNSTTTPSGGVRAGGGGMADMEYGLIALGALAAGSAGLFLVRRQWRKL